jgi:hypothetical protein
MGGRIIVATGVAGLMLLVAGVWPLLAMAIAMAGFMVPVGYSLVLYKRLERAGELDGPAQPG